MPDLIDSELQLLGVHHRDLPLIQRRLLAWDRTTSRSVLTRFRERHQGCGLGILATCSRTELYVDGCSPAAVHRLLGDGREAGCPASHGPWYELAGDEVAGHLAPSQRRALRRALHHHNQRLRALQPAPVGPTERGSPSPRAATARRVAGPRSQLRTTSP